jgi:hypothetical protein
MVKVVQVWYRTGREKVRSLVGGELEVGGFLEGGCRLA